MSEIMEMEDEAVIDEKIEAQEKEHAEKMKRMATALKAVAGWFSYLMGSSALLIGLFNQYGTEMFSVVFGTVVTLTGLVLLHMHVRQKALAGKERIVKGVKYTGGLLILPGFTGMNFMAGTPLAGFFSSMFFTGLAIFILSMVLKKAWGIKSPRRKRHEVAEIN